MVSPPQGMFKRSSSSPLTVNGHLKRVWLLVCNKNDPYSDHPIHMVNFMGNSVLSYFP